MAFNLGAVQSQLALACDRKTAEGLVASAKLFQVGGCWGLGGPGGVLFWRGSLAAVWRGSGGLPAAGENGSGSCS